LGKQRETLFIKAMNTKSLGNAKGNLLHQGDESEIPWESRGIPSS